MWRIIFGTAIVSIIWSFLVVFYVAPLMGL
jgi:hypothetical protein